MVVDPFIASNIMAALGKLDPGDNFSDFTVIVDGKEFQCHRFILNACSGFFSALLRSGMKESIENRVTVEGISSGVFSLILDSLYKGENVLTQENVIDVWYAVNLLQISFLVSECEKFVVDNLISNNNLGVYRHAQTLDSKTVKKAILDVVVKEFEKYSHTPWLQELYPEDIQYLAEQDDLQVSSEDVVVSAILKWASYSCEDDRDVKQSIIIKQSGEGDQTDVARDEQDVNTSGDRAVADALEDSKQQSSELLACSRHRQQYLGSLLKACRISLVSADCIEALMNNDMVLENKQAMSAVRQAVMSHLKPMPWSFSSFHRASSSMDNVAVFIEKKYVKAYSLRRNKTYFVSSLPTSGEGSLSLSVINNNLFALTVFSKGGFYSPSILLHHQIEQDKWCQVLENLPLQQAFVALDNYVYLFNSANICRFPVSALISRDTALEKICPSPLNKSINVYATVTHNKKIIYFCGDNQRSSGLVFCLNTQTNTINTLENIEMADNFITFKDELNTYILYDNGTLQRVKDHPDKGVDFLFMTKLWGFCWKVQGAIAFNRHLYLFGKSTSVSPGDVLDNTEARWSTCLAGYFDHIKVVFVDSRCQCLPMIMPKSWMDETDKNCKPKSNWD
ncbi:kelch-like protein 29 [Physella acuta]|uniref:kelch-like protein 29 n=1 Tax=Physella acuta TaxID=109671 RepID=UPI0027DAF620|nr:kelch-like protein 29 [Physella acuta]